jgi:hypothetical protein
MLLITCRDEDEYDNPYDEEAPPPPELLFPLPDTIMACGNTHHVFFDWTTVEGAERYDIQIDTSAGFHADSLFYDNDPPRTITLTRHGAQTKYYWRARGASVYWRKLFTDWSEMRVFYLVRDVK